MEYPRISDVMSKGKSENLLLHIQYIPNSPDKNSDHLRSKVKDFDKPTTENTEKGTFLFFAQLVRFEDSGYRVLS